MKNLHPRWFRAFSGLLLYGAPFVVIAAALSGTVTFPVSDGGYAPRTITTKVRVMGTQLVAQVVEDSVDRSTGTFSVSNVPNGPVTLLLEEPNENNVFGDRFTQDSKRLQLNVAGDVSGLEFAPVFHWQNLPSYPPPYHNPSYDIWQPYFISDQVGFMSFLNRGVSPFVHELWRTTNGGTSWSKIGEWVHGAASGIPDFVGNLDLLFVDADHGVMTARFGPPNYTPVGVLRTADGGATWEGIDFPNVPPSGSDPGGNGRITIVGYAAIDATHWIACGSENVGSYMGSGTPGYVTIWETSDAGATWRIGISWREDYGTCSVVSADPGGKAFVFDTPYAFGGNRILAVRDVSGTWALVPNNRMVANSGYGPADGPMLEGTAWLAGARWMDGQLSVEEQGLFYSLDGGASWFRISEALVQYFDFATALKAFATAGGPAYASYDGGETWRYQAQGGGICCHGDHMYAFAHDKAIWQDGGVGDPNGLSDVFRYVESAAPVLEAVRGDNVNDASARNGQSNVPALALRVVSYGSNPVALHPLRLKASGSGNDHTELDGVRLWWDRNRNGVVDDPDEYLTSGAFDTDDGEVVLDLGAGARLDQLYPKQLLVTLDVSLAIDRTRTFKLRLSPDRVIGTALVNQVPTNFTAVAPVGTKVIGPTITVTPQTPIPPATIAEKSATEGAYLSYTPPAFTDPNGDEPIYSFDGLPAWLTVYNPSANPRFLYGRPPYSESSASFDKTYTIGYTARDPFGNEARTTFAIRVVNANATPTAPAWIAPQTAPEGQVFAFAVPAFTDPDGDTLSYGYEGLPSWLTIYNPSTNPRYLQGTPPHTESGPVNNRAYWITVTATDPAGMKATKAFSLTVQNRNGPPTRPESIPAQTATEGVYFSYAVPVFPDPDGEPVTYSYSGLPAWLTVYNPSANPRFLYGKPSYTESSPSNRKTYWITVTATDSQSNSSSRVFSLTVMDATPP